MTNGQTNKSILLQKERNAEPIEFKVTARLEAEPQKEISRVHTVGAFSKITSKDIEDGKANVQGVLSVCALYETSEGEFAQAKQEANFSVPIQVFGASMLLVDVVMVNYDVLGFDDNTITVNLLLNANVIEIVSEEVSKEIEVAEGLVFDKATKNVSKVLGAGSCIFNVNQEVDAVMPNTTRIVNRNATVVITNAFAGIDVVTVEGNIFCTLLIEKDGKLENFKKVIDFKQEMECFGANPGSVVEAKAQVSSFMTGIIQDEQNSILSLVCELSAFAVSHASEEVEVINDAYSITQNVSLTTEAVTCYEINNVEYSSIDVTLSADITGRLGIDEVVGVLRTDVKDVCVKVKDGIMLLEGVVETVICYNNNMDETTQTIASVCPLLVERQMDEPYVDACDFNFIVNGFKLKTGNAVEIEGTLYFKQTDKIQKQVSYISNIEFSGEEKPQNSAIKVYIVGENERIFDIAKNLGVTVDNLLTQNPDLENGVVPGERIYVYVPLVVNF